MGLNRGRGRDKVRSDQQYRKTLGAVQLVPQKFRRQLKTTTIKQDVEADYEFPTALNTSEFQSYVDLYQLEEPNTLATLTTVTEQILQGSQLVSYRYTRDRQIETLTEQLVPESQPATPGSALITTDEQEAIGNGQSLLRLGTVPDVFDAVKYTVGIPILVPEIFRWAVPETRTAITLAGQATPPVLQPGQYEASDEQLDEFVHRLDTSGLGNLSVFPITISGFRTTKDKQVEHIDKTLQDINVVPLQPTALRDVTYQELGNTLALEEDDYVDYLFTKQRYEAELTDVIPHKFKALLPIKMDASVSVGTAAPPTLTTGDLKRTSTQENVFVVENTRQYRDPTTLPASITEYKMTGKRQLGILVATLAVGLQTLTLSELIEEASVEDLGVGISLKQVMSVASLFTAESFEKSIPDTIPEKFRAVVPTSRHSILSAGTASDPTLGTGELSHTSQQIDAFVKRDESTFRSTVGLPVSLTQYRMTRNKEIGTQTLTLAVGLQTLAGQISELTQEAAVENLGNNTSLKDITAVSALFTEPSYAKSIPDVIPERMRVAVPTLRTSLLIAGSAAVPPDPTGGTLSESQQQLDLFTFRKITESRAVVGSVSLTGYKWTKDKQIGTNVLTLANGLQNLNDADELTVEASVLNLGNGQSLKDKTDVGVLFTEDLYEKSIPDIIPERFRTSVPTSRHAYLIAGQATNPPNPTGGTISERRQSIDHETYREDLVSRAVISSSVILQGKENTEEYGGGVLDVIETLDAIANLSTTDTGRKVVSSRVLRLDPATGLKETKQLPSAADWQALVGTEVDPTYGVIINLTEQVVDAGTTGGISGNQYTEVKPLDIWRSKKIIQSVDAAALANYVLTFPGTVNLDRYLPPKLTALTAVFENSNANGSYNEGTPVGFWSGGGGFTLPQQSRSEGTASTGADAQFNVLPPFFPAKTTTRCVFFLPMPVTPAAVLAKLTDLLGTVTAWPTFDPQPITIQCISRRISLQAQANAHTQSGGNTCGSCGSCDGAASNGAGISSSTELTIKTIRVPPTIHPAYALNITQDNTATVQARVNPVVISGTCPITNGGADTGVVTMHAVGEVHCNESATAVQDYPSSGKSLLECNAQPYKYNYAMIHAEVFDFATL